MTYITPLLEPILESLQILYELKEDAAINLIHILTDATNDIYDEHIQAYTNIKIDKLIEAVCTARIKFNDKCDDDDECVEDELEPVVECSVSAVPDEYLQEKHDESEVKQQAFDLSDSNDIKPPHPKQLITKQKFNEYKRDEPDAVIKSSYALGKIGEDELVALLQETRTDFIVTKVSGTGHVGDIHIDDETNRIKYVVESKLKQKITSADITKFKADVESITADCTNKYVYGIFVSLNSQTISTIGASKCDKKTIYLTQQLISKDIFRIIFEMVPLYVKSLLAPSQTGDDQPSQRVEYTIPQRVREVIAQLHQINLDVKDEEAHLNEILQSASNITGQASQLQQKLFIRKNYLLDINFEMTASNISDKLAAVTSINIADTSLDTDREFLEYMRQTTKSAIKKKELMHKFPQHVTELSSMTLEDIIKTYKTPKTPKTYKTAKTAKTAKK